MRLMNTANVSAPYWFQFSLKYIPPLLLVTLEVLPHEDRIIFHNNLELNHQVRAKGLVGNKLTLNENGRTRSWRL